MADSMGEKTKQPPECEPNKFSHNPCPHLEEKSAWNSDRERYRCDRCGVAFDLHYDEMR